MGSNPTEDTKISIMSNDNSGRYYVIDEESGRKFLVEPIGNPHIKWGDINPATKKVEGDYGSKFRGSIDAADSVITEENGFKNIIVGEVGQSPSDIINKLLKK